MGCPPVRGDNPRALASGLSYVQVDNPWFIYTTYISVDLAHREIVRAKVGKGGIKTGDTLSLLAATLSSADNLCKPYPAKKRYENY